MFGVLQAKKKRPGWGEVPGRHGGYLLLEQGRGQRAETLKSNKKPF